MNHLNRPARQSARQRIVALAAMLGLVLLQACSDPSPPADSVRDVSALDAATAVREGVTVIDVRTDQEWAEGHLQAALHMPMATLEQSLAASGLDRSEPVLLHCKSGGRATRASRQFAEAGFTDIRVLKPGGFAELAAAGLPTTAPTE